MSDSGLPSELAALDQSLSAVSGLENALGPLSSEPPPSAAAPAAVVEAAPSATGDAAAAPAPAAAAASAVAAQASRAAQMARERLGPLGNGLGALVNGLSASDSMTRRMSTLFFTCSMGVIIVSVMTIYHLKTRSQPTAAELLAAQAPPEATVGEHLGEFLNKQTEDARLKAVLLNLGEFTVELKRSPTDRPVKGVVNMVELELFVECDTRETCEYVEAYAVQLRNHVSNGLIDLDREALLSREGKKKLKKSLIDRMNVWLPKGKIENVYFSRLIIG